MSYDLIIIGSGSVGAAAGYYAGRAGLRVLMLDACQPPHQQGSHHGATRLMRHAYGEGEKYVPLALRAQALWQELMTLSDEPLFDATGVLNFGPADSAFLAAAARSAGRYQLKVEKMSAGEIMRRWPEIRLPENYYGIFEPAAGVLYSERAVATLLHLAREAGCDQRFNCPATAIVHHPQGVEVSTSNGVFQGSKLLISAGIQLRTLLPTLPVQPVRKVFAWFQADGRYSRKNNFPAFTGEMPDGEQYYGFPAEDNELKIGKHSGGQPITAAAERKPFGAVAGDGAEAFRFLRTMLPGIGGCLHGAACAYDNSPDGDFIIDRLPDHPQSLTISGLSGHGFKFAPALGEIAARFALGEASLYDLSPFALARFQTCGDT